MGYVYARRGQVDVEISTDLETPDFISIGCPSGDVVVPRNTSPSSTEPDNWCVSQEGTVQQVDLGALVIEPTMTIEMDLADPAYDVLNDAFNSRDPILLRISATDGATSPGPNTHVLTYEVVITDFTLTFRGAAGATSQFSLTFHVNNVVSDVVTQPS